MSILKEIQAGADLKSFSIDKLEKLCEEIRCEILRVVNVNGGHLSDAVSGRLSAVYSGLSITTL